MGKELLLEIGTEEIPAAFLPRAMRDMEELIGRELAERRIGHGCIRTMATPRRLLLCVSELDECQEDQMHEKLGPAKSVAFDTAGNPTKAALGFAKGQGVDVSQLETVATEKGEYICVRKKITGAATISLLPEILPAFIAALPFRKAMRWSDLDVRFARPIHWIVALFDSRIVPFRIGNIESGDATRGHRFMSPTPVTVHDFADYIQKAKERFVIVDPDERKAMILAEAGAAARTAGGEILVNDALLEEVTFLTEYPNAVCGSFDAAYLDLPREVLTTSMITHQKYFPVIGKNGALLPAFVTINNTLARDSAVVARGNEKVIRARLSDARFFFEEDLKRPLADRVGDLKDVVFHTLLGTSLDKVERFRMLASFIAENIAPDLREKVDRVALLAKADLNTQMVGEFPDLQGIMGREYALRDGEEPPVAKAVYEHYLPIVAGGEIPESDEGAIVSIADKLDSIVGFFGVNLVPTGTADPYALRRQALGIIAIVLGREYRLDLAKLVEKSLSIYGGIMTRPHDETARDVLDFFRGRLENHLVQRGYSSDVVAAVLAGGFHDLRSAYRRIDAMEAFKKRPDFDPLAVAFKRVGNIIKNFVGGGAVSPDLFETPSESTLHRAFLEAREKVLGHLNRDEYEAALVELAGLREPVDAFFEAVLVMAEDPKVRYNRLSLLEHISSLFLKIADFAKVNAGT